MPLQLQWWRNSRTYGNKGLVKTFEDILREEDELRLDNSVVEDVTVRSTKDTWSKEPQPKAESQCPRIPSPQKSQGDNPKELHKERPRELKKMHPSKEGKREADVKVGKRRQRFRTTKEQFHKRPPQSFAGPPRSSPTQWRSIQGGMIFLQKLGQISYARLLDLPRVVEKYPRRGSTSASQSPIFKRMLDLSKIAQTSKSQL